MRVLRVYLTGSLLAWVFVSMRAVVFSHLKIRAQVQFEQNHRRHAARHEDYHRRHPTSTLNEPECQIFVLFRPFSVTQIIPYPRLTVSEYR